MKVKSFFKLRRENFIILFLNGQLYQVYCGSIHNKLIKFFQKPKYDFIVN